MTAYFQRQQIKTFPRIPLQGNIDITYRCNNMCRHCWLRTPQDAQEKNDELTLEEIEKITKEAKSMGCRHWNISGGEPMIREDFPEIFDLLTRKAVTYSLNTNGTLITRGIAGLLKRKGSKMVALYGATSDVHDRVTRNPGSFEAFMQGVSYLKEAGAGFTIQIVQMRDNFHQKDEMIEFAESTGRRWRMGASWLYLTECGDAKRNSEIKRQRLDPKEILIIDYPEIPDEKREDSDGQHFCQRNDEERLFAACIRARREFHLDPYGTISFCCFIKDPLLRYTIKDGSFKEFWDEFLPSISDKVIGTKEFRNNCGSCDIREYCPWCPVYGYLEHRNYSARVEYLCDIAKETKKYMENRIRNHRAFYKIAGITVQVDADLPISDNTFHPKFKFFKTDGPGEDTIFIQHHFSLPDITDVDFGKEVYRRLPWAIYRKNDSWVYVGISELSGNHHIHKVAVLNADHTRARIYNDGDRLFRKGGLHALTMFPSDQLLLARVLAEREGCYLHSSGVILNGNGLLFAGHADAGKSTISGMLKGRAEILCDDRIIVRKWPEGFMIHGTWSHGDIPDVSANSAPLKAILFLEKARENRIAPLHDGKEAISRILAYLIRPVETKDWWEKMLMLVHQLVKDVPCYLLYFDTSGEISNLVEEFVESGNNG